MSLIEFRFQTVWDPLRQQLHAIKVLADDSIGNVTLCELNAFDFIVCSSKKEAMMCPVCKERFSGRGWPRDVPFLYDAKQEVSN